MRADSVICERSGILTLSGEIFLASIDHGARWMMMQLLGTYIAGDYLSPFVWCLDHGRHCSIPKKFKLRANSWENYNFIMWSSKL